MKDKRRPQYYHWKSFFPATHRTFPRNNQRMTAAWNPDFAEQSPAFAPLRAAARELHGVAWPGCVDFNRLLAARGTPVTNAAGREIRFVGQTARAAAFDEGYEPRIFQRGEVQVRARNSHDLFNALVWLTFPRIKAALNERQHRALERQHANGAPNRGPAQDALTLLDEGGVIVVTSDATLGRLLADHAWKELFWRRRAEVEQGMRFYLLGHGLYAKMQRPFVGVTGRGTLCVVPADFLALPLASQLAELDARLAALIADPAREIAARELMAVPLLGIPGWCAGNAREDYYDNAAYFRPLPTREGRR